MAMSETTQRTGTTRPELAQHAKRGEGMTKADLVEQVYEAIGPGVTKKDCAAVVEAFLNAIKQALAHGEHIEIRGFGTFKVRHRKPRLARNPRTGESVQVPAREVPVFKPSRLFKEDVDESEHT